MSFVDATVPSSSTLDPRAWRRTGDDGCWATWILGPLPPTTFSRGSSPWPTILSSSKGSFRAKLSMALLAASSARALIRRLSSSICSSLRHGNTAIPSTVLIVTGSESNRLTVRGVVGAVVCGVNVSCSGGAGELEGRVCDGRP